MKFALKVVLLVIALFLGWKLYKRNVESYLEYSWVSNDVDTPYTDNVYTGTPSYAGEVNASSTFAPDVTPPQAVVQSSPDMPLSVVPGNAVVYTAGGTVATSTPLMQPTLYQV